MESCVLLKLVSISLVSAALCACAVSTAARYTVPENAPTATLALNAGSDWTGVTGRHYKALLFPGNDCRIDNKNLIGQELMGEASISMAGAAIPAGRPLRLGLFYSESRAGEIRSCTSMIEFTPVAGERYTARFDAKRQATTCAMTLSDQQGSRTGTTTPGDCEYILDVGGSRRFKVELVR